MTDMQIVITLPTKEQKAFDLLTQLYLSMDLVEPGVYRIDDTLVQDIRAWYDQWKYNL